MTKYFTTDAERNEYYIKIADKNAKKELRYINGVLCVDSVPTTDKLFIDSQNDMFKAMSEIKELAEMPELYKQFVA